MKKALIVLLVAAAVAGAGAWYFISFRLDGVVRNRIEQAATASLGTQVSVGGVSTSIRDGSLQISNITVANPPGFSNPHAFSLNNIEAAVDYANRDIKRVVIEQPEIVIEETGGQTNVARLLDGLQQRESEPAPETGGAEAPVIVIRHFRMNESRAAFESASLDRYTDVEVDAIELNDIRGTPDEVARAIASEVLSEVVSEAATELVKAQAKKKLDDVGGKVSETLKGLMGRDDDSETQ